MSDLKPRAISRFCHHKLVRGITSLCSVRMRRVGKKSNAHSGSTHGVMGSVTRSIRIPFRHIIFTLNVHFINRVTTGALTHRFGSVSTLTSTSLRSVLRVGNVNAIVTRDIVQCFTGRSGHVLIDHLRRQNMDVALSRRRLDGRSSELTKRNVIIDNIFSVRSHSRCGTVVRRRNNGGINDVSTGASFILTNTGVKPTGLRGTGGLNVPVLSRRRFLGGVRS